MTRQNTSDKSETKTQPDFAAGINEMILAECQPLFGCPLLHIFPSGFASENRVVDADPNLIGEPISPDLDHRRVANCTRIFAEMGSW
ncbi:MAG: hypothetical protein H7839_04315 [Magnetococcus sp. YQC-5]